MVDLRDVRIQRDEFEIAQRDRLFRLLQPLRVRTLTFFEQVRDHSNFSLDITVAWEIVSGDQPRNVQEKLSAQSYGSMARSRAYEKIFSSRPRTSAMRSSMEGGRLISAGS